MPIGDVAPELALLVGAVIVLVFTLVAPRRWQAWSAALAIATLVVAAIITTSMLTDTPRLSFAGTYAVDGAALWGKLLVLGVTAGVAALSVEWFETDPRRGEYFALLLLGALGAVAMAAAADLMELLLAVLLSTSTGAVLIGYHRRSRRAGEAALKFYLLGALTNGAMTFGVVLLFGLAASTTYSRLLADLGNADALPMVVALGLIVLGLAFKLGAVPAHMWLPDAADGAPAPVATFVAAAPKIGALIAIARLVAVLPEASSGWRVVIAVVAAATMTLGNVAALWQDDVRRLLGWSAVSQAGYGLMAVVALGRSALAVPALVYFLFAYALATLATFGVVVLLRGQADRAQYAGLASTRPWLAFAMLIGLLSFVGVPPLAGFGAKLALFGAAIEAGYGWLAIVAIANTALSVAYYARIFEPMYVGDVTMRLPVLSSRVAVAAVVVAVAGVIAGGLFAQGGFGPLADTRLLPTRDERPMVRRSLTVHSTGVQGVTVRGM